MSKDYLYDKNPSPKFNRRKVIFGGKDSDSIIKGFFGCTATITIFILGLIMIFLVKEGSGFLGQYQESQKYYRLSGLEYVDILKELREDHTALTRYLNSIKSNWIKDLRNLGKTQKEVSELVFSKDARSFFNGYSRTSREVKKYIKSKMDLAIETKDLQITNDNINDSLLLYTKRISEIEAIDFKLSLEDRSDFILKVNDKIISIPQGSLEYDQYVNLKSNLDNNLPITNETKKVYLKFYQEEYQNSVTKLKPINYNKTIEKIVGDQLLYFSLLDSLVIQMKESLNKIDVIETNNKSINKQIVKFKDLNKIFIESIDTHKAKVLKWDHLEDTKFWESLKLFLTGSDWITASDQHDKYGLLPLLSGSLLISFIALLISVPLGVGAAIYTNQIASNKEKNWIKPYIEFISAVPSVVIGFFGIAVLGELIRNFSQIDLLSWIPFFPIQERLNVLNAGCLLALMATPTIYTLSEDAINNVPNHLKQTSLAIGATHLQTSLRIIIPNALSGIISAIMLGFGRVIGETMVVLLCAGNRIKIPELSDGLGIFFQPVHTMTGIIAQEMGEVVHGSIHYRALFMVGIVLFIISLLINFSAQWILKRSKTT